MKRLGEEEANDEERQAEQEKLRQERLDAGMSLDDVLRLEESQEELDGKAERKVFTMASVILCFQIPPI